MDESVVGTSLLREPTGANIGVAYAYEEALGGIQETLFGCKPASGVCHANLLIRDSD
jgi:hypothetical protein